MRLADFICDNVEPILCEWESFARGIWPKGVSIAVGGLRDHAEDIIRWTIADMRCNQSSDQQSQKSRGAAAFTADTLPLNVASDQHALERVRSGFALMALVAEYRALRASVIRLWGKSGGVRDANDLYDLTRFNESIDQSLARATQTYTEQVDKSRRIFLAILGHDLRNPLHSMTMIGQLLLSEQERLDPESRSLITQFSQSASAMSRMIKDLLDFTAAGLGGDMPLTMGPLDLEDLASEVVGEMRAGYPSVTFGVELRGDLKGTWDVARLRQVLSNLLGNAVQYGRQSGEIRLVIRDEGAVICLTVQNEGSPIPAEALPTIFEPLVQGTSPELQAMRRPGSIGLGLYIAREVVNAHGGSIDAESTKETGTTFTVRLPRQAPAAAKPITTPAKETALPN